LARLHAFQPHTLARMLQLTLLLAVPEYLQAEEPEFEPIHWAFSSFFGTGWYQVHDNRSVFVLRMTPRQTIRESGISESGEGEFGITIKYPLTLGLHGIDEFSEIIQSDNFGTISFTPGIELEIPINQRWYLRPFANVGWGTEFDSSNSVWIYYAGVKSRYTFPGQKFDWSLLSSIYYAGYTPDTGRSDRLAVAQLGVEFTQPINARFLGRAVNLNYNFMYSFLGRDLHFGLPDGSFDPIEDQFEAGIALSFRNRPYKVWFYKVHRLGLGYKFSSDGQFKAITINLRSWFTS